MLELDTMEHPPQTLATGTAPDLKGLTAFLDMFDANQRPSFIAAFVEEMEGRRTALCQAQAEKDTAMIRRQAHGIKGTSATFQLNDLSRQAAGVEVLEGNDKDLLSASQNLAERLSLTLKAVAALDL